MGHTTDVYSQAVNTYVTQSTAVKNQLTAAQNQIIAQYQAFTVAQQTQSATLEKQAKQSPNASTSADVPWSSAVRDAWNDYQTAKGDETTAKATLKGLLDTFKTATTKFEAYIKKKAILVKLNPLKGKDSMPTAKLTIQHAKALIVNDSQLLT